jgi:ABC-type transport system substrate-binding protein
MIKRAVLPLALLLTAACATTPAMNSSTPGSAQLQPTDYVLLTSPTNLQSLDPSTSTGVWGLHVNGTMTNRGFYPIGKVEGHGDLCTDGKDWLSLSDLKVHKASEGGSPAAPYLLGCASNSGFKPASRDIVMQ